MMVSKIVILTNHSLLADGLISRLREYLDSLELQVFDADQVDVLTQIIAFQPSVVILEESEAQQLETCLLKHMLSILPNLMVIYLRLGQQDIQVIESEQYPAKEVKEVVDIIRQSRSHHAGHILQQAAKSLPVSQAVGQKQGVSH